jgi:hypothetical protein
MEFYSAIKKNEILSFASRWMELENIFWARLARLRRPKITCSPSYEDFRSRANTAICLDLGHMMTNNNVPCNIKSKTKKKLTPDYIWQTNYQVSIQLKL